MHWYNGSIAEAVTLSKQKNAIFVVFVEGDNELSTEMASTIDKEVVLSKLSDQNNFLAVKLKSGTVDYSHFAQLYQLVPVPSLFFIGRNGTPLEVVCAGMQPENLAERIDRILQEHHKEKPPSIAASTSFSQAKEQSANLLLSEASTSQTSNKPGKPEEKRSNEEAGLASEQLISETTINEQTNSNAETQQCDNVNDKPKRVVILTRRSDFIEKRTSVFERRFEPPDGLESGSASKIQKTESTTKPIPKPIETTDNKEAKENIHLAGKPGPEFEVVCQDDVCVRRVKVADGAGTSQAVTPQLQPSSEAVIEDKLQRAKQLIEAKNKEKMEKEKELERQKELERRALGHGVAEMKRWQADQELKQIQEERKREKLENNLARQRVLEQIALDRAERRARDSAPAARDPAPPARDPAPTSHTPTFGDTSSGTRVSLKLPDGVTHSANFRAEDSLNTVHSYITDQLNVTSPFSLWTAFPRRELIDLSATLRDLQLVPSAALLVLPRRQASEVAAPNTWANIITFLTQFFTTMVLDPASQLYNWVRSRFPDRPGSGDRPAPFRSPGAVTGTTGTSTDSNRPDNTAAYRRKNNVHRLSRDPPNDDNNTWNGNSTQQM